MTLHSEAVRLDQVQFAWPKSPHLVIDIEQLTVKTNQHVFIKGPSGSGKSTLLSLLTGMMTPQTGEIHLLGHNLGQLTQAQRDQFRSHHIGYIFQQFNLLPYLSVIENVLLPCRFSHLRQRQTTHNHHTAEQQAEQLLHRLQLPADCFQRSVNQLSIGQQQRVAAARALIGQPELIIADEPTSSLDADNRQVFIELLLEEANQSGATVLFVSHDASLQRYFERCIDLTDINRVNPFTSAEKLS
nr:ABC transporter ATP-binding protein [Vibrio aphrogenes]